MKTCSVVLCSKKHYARGFCRYHYNMWRKENAAVIAYDKSTRSTVCSVDGCAKKVKSRGLCEQHYRRWLKGAKVNKCSIDGCDNPSEFRGLCSRHYQSTRKVDGSFTGNYCSVDGCNKGVVARGYCNVHYDHWREYGNPLTVTKRPPGTGTISNGYVVLSGYHGHPNAQKSGKIMEHVLVMSNMLGRPLVKGEQVHHKNGNRQDNRPENLELILKYNHHAGQKLEDIIEHYLPDYIELYGVDKVQELINEYTEPQTERSGTCP